MIIARGYCAQRGWNLAVVPGFVTVYIKGDEKSAITLRCILAP